MVQESQGKKVFQKGNDYLYLCNRDENKKKEKYPLDLETCQSLVILSRAFGRIRQAETK